MTTEDQLPESGAAASSQATPGQILREAREARGLHLGMLAVTLKVPTRQLEALERDDYEAFKGVAFLRALAQSVCRHLGVDSAPVLAGLPKTESRIDGKSAPMLNQPLRDLRSSGVVVPRRQASNRQVLWLTLVLFIVALAWVWWPSFQDPAPSPPVLQTPTQQPLAQALDQASSPQPLPVSSNQAISLPSAPPVAVEPVSPAPLSLASAAASGSDVLTVNAQANVWVEIRDRRGELVLQRQLRAGETVKLELAAPLFIYVSRADSTQVLWRGLPVDLLSGAQNNEARLKIKP